MTTGEFSVIWLTIKVALVSTTAVFPAALWLGWALARKKLLFAPFVEAILTVPLVAPPVVTGYMLLVLLGKNGMLGGWLFKITGISLTFNFVALVIASAIVSLPLAVRSIRSSIEMVDPGYEKASLGLGVSRFFTFFRVTFPLAYPGIISGMVLSFARALGEFGATITIAGNIEGKTRTISQMIYTNMQVPGMENKAMRMVVFSIIISLLAIIIAEIINRKQQYLKNAGTPSEQRKVFC